MADLTDREIKKMQAAIEAHTAKVEADKAAAKVAYVKPVQDIVDSAEFQAVRDKLTAIAAQFQNDFHIWVHINTILTAMPNLKAGIEFVKTAP